MKLKLFAIAISLALILSACDKQEEKFAGFTPIGENKKVAKFYLDTNTVKRDRSGWVRFNMVRDLTDSYVIQNAETNCENHFITEEGVKYRQDGTSQEKFASETMLLPIDKRDITALVKMACDTAEENRNIKGAFDDGKALEILFGNYDANNKTASWEKIDPPTSLESYEKFAGETGIVKVLESKDFEQDGKMKHILLTLTSVSYVDNTLLSSIVFVKNDDKWRIEKEHSYLKVFKKDFPKTLRWEQIGKERYGLIDGGISKSHEEFEDNTGYITLYEINEKGLHSLIDYSNKNSPLYLRAMDKNDDLNVIFSKSEKPYWDATLIFSKNGEKKMENVYLFQGNKYVSLWMKALTELFGVTDSSGEIKKADKLSKIWFEQFFKDSNSNNNHVVFVRTSNESSWGEVAQAGAVVFTQIRGEWQVTSKQSKIGEVPSSCSFVYENAPMLNFSSNKIAFLIDVTGCLGNHYSYENRNVYVYQNNNWIDLVGNIELESEYFGGIEGCYNKGDKHQEDVFECYGYDGKISMVDRKKEYPDLLVTKTGTEEIDGKVVPAKNSLYVFNGKEYEEKKNAKIPTVKKEIELKNGIAFIPNTSIPFTGKLKSISPDRVYETDYKDGKKHGLDYMKNDFQTLEHHYINGKENGLRRSWILGKIDREENYKNDKLDGLSVLYSNGKKWLEINYKNDKQDGLKTVYYPNGQKKIEESYNNGKKISEKSFEEK